MKHTGLLPYLTENIDNMQELLRSLSCVMLFFVRLELPHRIILVLAYKLTVVVCVFCTVCVDSDLGSITGTLFLFAHVKEDVYRSYISHTSSLCQ